MVEGGPSVWLPAVLLLLFAIDRLWVTEDAYITMQSVENLWEGYGPNFNRGLRVESFSHPLWFLILVILRVFGASALPMIAAWTGVLLSVAGLWFVSDAARSRLPAGATLPWGGMVIACLPAFWDFASSGLETGPTFLWIGASAWLLTRTVHGERPAGAPVPALILGMAPLIRPDLAVLAAPLVLVEIVSRWRAGLRGPHLLLGLLWFLLPGLAWQIFRMGYYGLLVPNTYLAKEGFGTRWDQGLWYLRDLVGLYHLAWVLPIGAVLAFPGWRRVPRTTLVPVALIAAAVLHATLVIRAGGDFMHARLLLPALFSVAAAVAVVPAPSGRVLRRVALLVLVGWSVTIALRARPVYSSNIDPHGIADEREWYVQRARTTRPVGLEDFRFHTFHRVGRAMAELCRRSGYRAAYWAHIGLAVAVAPDDITVIDPLALNDHIGSHIELRSRARPGHEKTVRAAWFLARYPPGQGFVVRQQLGGIFETPEPPEALAAARRVLDSPPLRELEEAVSAPMTPVRFFRNFFASPRLTLLRIPPDPLEAERLFVTNGGSTAPPP